MTSDKSIHEHITALVAEEKSLRDQLSTGEITRDEERTRLHAVEVELDRAWDLLRQRKALRETGGSPDDATERPEDVVEGYLD
jgi:hypothetical protein